MRRRKPPAKQQGPGSRGSPGPVRPMESRGPGAKTACVAFWIRGALGLWFAARGDFPFAECSCQKLVWGRRCDGASALSGRAGTGGMAGDFARASCGDRVQPPVVAEPLKNRNRALGAPSNAAGPREPCAVHATAATGSDSLRGRDALPIFSGSEAHWGCGLLPEECFTLQNAVPRSSFGAVGATGPRR